MEQTAIRLLCLIHCKLCFDTLTQGCRVRPGFQILDSPSMGLCDAELIVEMKPDVLLLDLDLEGDVQKLAEDVRRLSADIHVAVIGTKWTDINLLQSLKSGVEGVLLKTESADALFEHLRQVSLGRTRISAGLCERLRYDDRRNTYMLATTSPLTTFTGQQLEILRLLACGDSLKMVASKLKLSRKSIDGHKYRIMRKLGINDRVLLSRLAIREGLIKP